MKSPPLLVAISIAVVALGCAPGRTRGSKLTALPSRPTQPLSHIDAAVEDWRGTNTGGVCPVHHIAMRIEIVPNLKAGVCILFADDYNQARATRFPYAGIEFGQEFYGEKRGKIYICAACLKAREN